MRVDVFLPFLLAAALAVMVVYAATGDSDRSAVFATTPLECRDARMLASIPELREASGLATSRRASNLFWAHNDSAQPIVVALNADGRVKARVRIAGAAVEDWEAVTTAPCESGSCLYVGDIGDNDRRRPHVVVYRTHEPRPGDEATAPASAIRVSYPEGPQDAEALFAHGGALYIVTKGEGAPVRLYRLPSHEAGTHRLQLVATLSPAAADKGFRVTDAARSPDDRWIALRTNDQLLVYDAHQLLTGRIGTPYAYDLRGLNEQQGEGLAWVDDRTLFLAGEGKGAGTFARVSCTLPVDGNAVR